MIKTLNSIKDLESFLKAIKDTPFLFRGHSCAEWKLEPSIARGNFDDKYERSEFSKFKNFLLNEGYFNTSYQHSDYRVLALAQHVSRFPTRLLDWTSDVFVALFFSSEYNQDVDGALWVFPAPKNQDAIWLRNEEESPFDAQKLTLFHATSFIDDYEIFSDGERLIGNNKDLHQKSLMTLHPRLSKGYVEFTNDILSEHALRKVIISSVVKREIQSFLDNEPYYINKESLFDGSLPCDIRFRRNIRKILESQAMNK